MPLTAEDLAAIGGLIDTKLESAKTEGINADTLVKVVKEQLGALKLDEKILNAVEAAKDDGKKKKDEDEDEDEKRKKGETAREYDARMKALEERQKELEDREKRAAATEREAKLRDEIANGLLAAGIPADRHPQAIAFLRTKTSSASGKPVIDYTEDGRPIFRRAGKGYDDDLTIEKGLQEWASTDEAKLYQPPAPRKGAGGGAGGGSRPGAGGKTTSVNEILGSLEL